MLAIRSIILVFVLFCWKTSKKFLLTFERKKSRASGVFFFQNAWKSQDIRGARVIIDSETDSFTEEPIHEYFAQCRYHSSHLVHKL